MSFEEYQRLVSELSNKPLSKINKHARFRDDLHIDSLQMVNLIVEISTRFNLGIPKINNNNDLKTVEGLYKIMSGEG